MENCSLEHLIRLLVYVDTVAVVRPEYSGQGQLQDPSVSVDRQEVGQGEGSLLGGDLSVPRPVQVAAPAPGVDTLRAGPGVDPLVGQLTVRLHQGGAALAQILSSEQVSRLSDEFRAVGLIAGKSGQFSVLA